MYVVKSPIHFGGARYEPPAELDLPDDVAERFLSLGCVERVSVAAPEAEAPAGEALTPAPAPVPAADAASEPEPTEDDAADEDAEPSAEPSSERSTRRRRKRR